MPTVQRGRSGSNERFVQTLMDWMRKAMQLSAVASIVLFAYILWGFLGPGAEQWGSLTPAARLRITQNLQGAIGYLNVSVGILLITVCVLFVDEESLGYSMITVGAVLYYGVPFLFDMFFPGQLATWSQTKNMAALSLYNELRLLGLFAVVPGGLLTVRDIFIRCTDGGRRSQEDFTAMQYGGATKEEAPVGAPLIGMLAKCWQLPFCRDAIRKNCPIYHAKTRCWRERVGCMCEESVIRQAMDAVLHKEETAKDFDLSLDPAEEGIGKEPTIKIKLPPRVPTTVNKRNVKIPHNPNLTMDQKKQRCRNCVIYNEHQRMKYQFFAPITVAAVPALAVWQMGPIADTLNNLLKTVDSAMVKLSLDPSAKNLGVASSIPPAAQYVVLGCLVVVGTTLALRFLEYCMFRLKI